MKTEVQIETKLPSAGTYVRFRKNSYPAKKNQLGRISEDGKSVGIWWNGLPVYVTKVDASVLRVITKTELKKMKK